MLRRKIKDFDKRNSKLSNFYCLEPRLYPFIMDIVEAMNTLIQERHNSNKICITVRVSRRTQNIETYLANEGPVVAIFSTDLRYIFRSNVGNELRVMLRGKGPLKPNFAYDIVSIHSLMIYTDLIEYKIIGNTKTPWLRCFLFVSKLKAGHIITTGQYMNYQTFSNLHSKPLLKIFFHSLLIDLRDTSGAKIPFVSLRITRPVLMFKKASNIHF